MVQVEVHEVLEDHQSFPSERIFPGAPGYRCKQMLHWLIQLPQDKRLDIHHVVLSKLTTQK